MSRKDHGDMLTTLSTKTNPEEATLTLIQILTITTTITGIEMHLMASITDQDIPLTQNNRFQA